MKNVIRFTHNWNGKLSQDVFTTIRNYTFDKYNYYLKSVTREFDVWLKGSGVIKKAILVDAERYEYEAIPDGFVAVDTGITEPIKALQLFKDFGMKSRISDMIILTFGPVNG